MYLYSPYISSNLTTDNVYNITLKYKKSTKVKVILGQLLHVIYIFSNYYNFDIDLMLNSKVYGWAENLINQAT